MKESFINFIALLLFVFFSFKPISQAIELNLTDAQEAVGLRFASKYCEAKKEGFSSDSSSEFALNNTYLKFVVFPDDKKFIEDLWDYTLLNINKDCGEYVNEYEVIKLKDFFQEESNIASNRSLYLPH